MLFYCVGEVFLLKKRQNSTERLKVCDCSSVKNLGQKLHLRHCSQCWEQEGEKKEVEWILWIPCACCGVGQPAHDLLYGGEGC